MPEGGAELFVGGAIGVDVLGGLTVLGCGEAEV
jgi:hypothetical protein